MTAADSTSKGQFGWIEDTQVTHRPAENEFSPASTVGHSSMTRVAMDEADTIGEDRIAPQEARITANWSSVSPHLHSDKDIEAGRNFHELPAGIDPVADPDAWNAKKHPRQGTLLNAGRESPPKVDFMESTKRSRFATMGGLGALANVVHEQTGKLPIASSDLSEHSAPLVGRITGEEQKVSNDMDFVKPLQREMVDLPETELHNVYSDDSAWSQTKRTSVTTFRTVPDTEIAAGKAMLVTHMRAIRGPKPDTTEKMFPDPGGPSLEEHQANTDKAGRVEAVLKRHRADQEKPL